MQYLFHMNYGKILKGDYMAIKIGEINQLSVLRQTDIGFILTDTHEEVFLHNNDSNFRNLKPNDKVAAFIYFDNKGRVAATLKEPLITIGNPTFLKVSAIHHDLGVFLDMGINKDILLSKDDLPDDYELWPQKDDLLYVNLKLKHRLTAKLHPIHEIKLSPETELALKSNVLSIVHKIGREGINLLTKEGHTIFVHQSLIHETYRIGQEVNVKITYKSDKGYSGSLIKQKEVLMHDDANRILSYLIKNGEMNLTSDSDSIDIFNQFQLSKKAFKRALGTLYKQRKIDFKDQKTVLVNKKGDKNEY